MASQLTPNAALIFRKAVQHILTDWPSLELAIDQGMGGDQAKEKRDWMISTLTDSMLKGKDVDVRDFLDDVLDNEFDTILEDGSIEYNGHWIEKFYKDCLAGKEEDVNYAITQASLKKLTLDKIPKPKPICETKDEDEDDSESDSNEDDNER